MPIDDQIRQALDRAIVGVRAHLEADLRTLAQDLARATTEDRSRAVAEATEVAVADVRQRAHQQLALVRDTAQKHADELRRSAATQIADLRRALEEAGRRAQADIEDARRTAQAQVDDVQRAMAAQAAELQGRLADTERRLHGALREVEDLRTSSAAKADELIGSQPAVAAARYERQQRAAGDGAQTAGLRVAHEQTERLGHAVASLDEGRSLGEVLELLARAAAGEADRVAVLISGGERLAGWSLIGFGEKSPPPRTISLDLDAAGLPGAVIRTGSPDVAHEADASLPAFARDAGARHALALPLLVGGTPVAVLYADVPAGDARADERWATALDVLARHASKVLEALTVQRVTGLSPPRQLARPSHPVGGLSHDRGVQ